MLQLKNYQIDQVRFLERHSCDKELFDSTISLQSPTGSGKSITILAFIKDYIDRHPDAQIFISTGFVNLAYQFLYEALGFGIKANILIGKTNCSCLARMERYGDMNHLAFEENSPKRIRCKRNECHTCNNYKDEKCLYERVFTDISSGKYNLTITNHSTFLNRQEFFEKHFVGGFIDECQSFPGFYDLYLKIEITPGEIFSFKKYIDDNYVGQQKPIESSVFGNAIYNGNITPRAFLNMLNVKVKGDKGIKRAGYYFHLLEDEVKKWDTVQDAPNVFIHPQIENGKFGGIIVDRFFNKFYCKIPLCLVSATVDSYTKNVFNCRNNYVEQNCHLTNYSMSTFTVYDDFTRQNVIDFINQQTGDHGLILSTRLDIVEEYLNLGHVCGYELIKSPYLFEDNKKQILIGSRSLFQGIDIGDISFVLINKIPFTRYDNSYKKKMKYFESLGMNAYNQYTIPYTENQLIQCMGRLWRHAGDYGNIALFDKRAKTNQYRLVNTALQERKGIRTFYR